VFLKCILVQKVGFVKYKFPYQIHDNPSSESPVVPWRTGGRTDTPEEANSRFVQFFKRA